MKNLLDCSQHSILITGGSKGIGRATAELLLQYGATVTVVSRTKEDLDKMKNDMSSFAGALHTISSDVSEPDAPAKIFESYCEIK